MTHNTGSKMLIALLLKIKNQAQGFHLREEERGSIRSFCMDYLSSLISLIIKCCRLFLLIRDASIATNTLQVWLIFIPLAPVCCTRTSRPRMSLLMKILQQKLQMQESGIFLEDPMQWARLLKWKLMRFFLLQSMTPNTYILTDMTACLQYYIMLSSVLEG